MRRLLTTAIAALAVCCGKSDVYFGQPLPDGGDTDPDGDTDADSDSDGDPVLTCATGGNCGQQFCEQVLIPAGVYPRGANQQADPPPFQVSCLEFDFGDETPEHEVELDAFCIDKYEVTWERYYACVEQNSCWEGAIDPDEAPGSQAPMLTANYQKAEAYCAWIGRRLCTEAEWERAANGPGPDKRTYPWGEDDSWLDLPWFDPDAAWDASDVDEYPELASVEGVYGLSGGALELVRDYYDEYQPADDGPLENPNGPSSGDFRLARGGGARVASNFTTTERVIIGVEYSQTDYDYW
jgi:formylglycine-generating enzyme required for sulfatase activity